MDIFDAVYANNTKEIEKIVKSNPSLLHATYLGMAEWLTLLHMAAGDGHIEACAMLCALGIDINTPSIASGYITPLIEAASFGNLDLVKWFIEHGASINGHPRGVATPLIVASRAGHADIVNYLLTQSPDINRLLSKLNYTALDEARRYNHPEVAELLVAAGALMASELIDLEAERAPGILECFHKNVGWILSGKFTKTIGNYQVDVRTALVGNGKAHKVLFTLGAYEKKPCEEFLICLPYDWPLNDALLAENDSSVFPVAALWAISQHWLTGHDVDEGFVMEKTDARWSSLKWPAAIDGLVVMDYQFAPESDSDEIADDDIATLLLLCPIIYTKSGKPSGKKLQEWIDKRRHLKWHRVSLKSEWLD